MRRKGELSKYAIDRDWPHQVALPVSFTVPNYDPIHQFCESESLSLCRLGHSFHRDGQYFQVYCFAEAEHAQRFRERFDGEPIAPKDRPPWPGKKRSR